MTRSIEPAPSQSLSMRFLIKFVWFRAQQIPLCVYECVCVSACVCVCGMCSSSIDDTCVSHLRVQPLRASGNQSIKCAQQLLPLTANGKRWVPHRMSYGYIRASDTPHCPCPAPFRSMLNRKRTGTNRARRTATETLRDFSNWERAHNLKSSSRLETHFNWKEILMSSTKWNRQHA